jgi:hypothetical protein
VLLGAFLALRGGEEPTGGTPQAGVQPTEDVPAPTFPTQTYADRGLSVNVPEGWRKNGGGGVWIDYVDPEDSNRKVRILVENSRADSAKFLQAAANRLKQNTSGSCARPYEQVALEEATAGAETGSRLEYTCGEGDAKRHGVWQAVVQGGKAYSFFLTTPDARFEESKPIFDEMVRSFQVTAA